MKKKLFNYLILATFIIGLTSLTVSSAVQRIVGLAIAQSSTKWGSLKDASQGDNLTTGIGVFSPYLYDGTNFDAARGDTTNGLDVDVTRISGTVTIAGGQTPSDTYTNPTDALDTYSLIGIYNGSTWDRAPGNTTNGLLVNLGTNNDVSATITAIPVSGTAFYAIKTTISATAVTGEVLGTGDGSTLVFSGTLANVLDVRSSITVHYTIASSAYTATDDGAGTITGTSVSGTINYTTGAWTLTYTTAPDSGIDITIDYTYQTSTNLAFGFTSKKLILETSGANTAEVCVDWIGGTAECAPTGTAGDDTVSSSRSVVLDDYAQTSISITTTSTTSQTVFVRAYN